MIESWWQDSSNSHFLRQVSQVLGEWFQKQEFQMQNRIPDTEQFLAWSREGVDSN